MARSLTLTRYIPEGAVVAVDDQSDALVATYEKNGVLFAIAYHGKAQRPDWHFRFRDAVQRDQRISRHFEARRAHAQRKAERRAENAGRPLKLEVGHILTSSWGYEQTNVDFYQVTRIIGAQTVEIRKIASRTEETGFMSGNCFPIADQFTGEPMTKRVTRGDGVKIASYAWASLWDGHPKRCSWYG